MKILINFLVIASLTSCTISLINVSSNGKASDMIDEQQDASPTVTPTVSLPVKAI